MAPHGDCGLDQACPGNLLRELARKSSALIWMSVSLDMVRFHVRKIYERLHVQSVVEAFHMTSKRDAE